MDATVIVCTYNRAASLADTLAALAALELAPGFEWELVVVDNNSRDATRQTVEDFAAAHPALALRYVFEARQGLSHARNRGIAEARGAILAFTDDDVLPAPDWLALLVRGMEEHGCAAAGGYIAPLWLAPPPAWLTERFYGFLALKTDEDGPKPVSEPEHMPFGASLVFRREVFERLGGFDPNLGRKGAVLAGGEEIDVLMRVVHDGGRVVYFPQARVRHKVEAFRLNKRYFRRWRYQCSRNEAAALPATGRRIAGVPAYLLPQLARAVGKAAWMRLTSPADEAFRQEMIVWHFLGLMRGAAARSA
ncbi:glycosyltransferase [Rubrivivax gelatinosus]|uniref:Glycosyl transferase family 2 n=1 Tax=Rubrivivax gelatinosus TaxID=28068 RepID=A0ABS1DWF6_RUBGE|nr:glycosyltransferase [Rubrivivax gelatinosus]MBK1714384.1 glycosyl transferase family 2 [Rubrivivax gelatinosus]